MKSTQSPEFWFICGSQHLYGAEPLKVVARNAREIAGTLAGSPAISGHLIFKALVTTPEEITNVLLEAGAAPECGGVILWMHTFSPSKMWIRGLKALSKPFLHFHTQFNRELPWSDIDMDFMNLNQSAHGDREAGFIHSRLRLRRKVVVGHWSDPEVQARIDAWMRAAHAWHDWQGAKFVRLGDNMRQVAVTDGDKVAAEARFGFTVDAHGLGEVTTLCGEVSDSAIDALTEEYEASYTVGLDLAKGGARHSSVREAARIELALRAFLDSTGARGFTDCFEDLHGLRQLPGIAAQRLMADGYGFGAEGDWKVAALVRAMKIMGDGVPGGTSFMEDYTYHLAPGGSLVLGSHMLEVCPSIAASRPALEVHPLGIGNKENPARLVFDAPPGEALNASLVDMGNRFRLIVNEVTAVSAPEPLPKLPVARAVWRCQPDFKTACAAWIHAGGAHHTGYSYSVRTEHLEDLAEIAGIELVVIDHETRLRDFKRDLHQNDVAYALAQGLRD
jgi:L-arabinose isomerase